MNVIWRFMIIAGIAGMALAACGSPAGHVAPSHAATRASRAAVSHVMPSWCLPVALAATGSDPAALYKYRKDNAAIDDLFEVWAYAEVANKLVFHPRSIVWIMNNAPVTTGALATDVPLDSKAINKACGRPVLHDTGFP